MFVGTYLRDHYTPSHPGIGSRVQRACRVCRVYRFIGVLGFKRFIGFIGFVGFIWFRVTLRPPEKQSSALKVHRGKYKLPQGPTEYL